MIPSNILDVFATSFTIETSIEYLEAREVPDNSDSGYPDTQIEGIVTNEGILPDLGLAVRCSQKFRCLQPGSRHYAEPSDFTLEPGVNWDIFQENDLHDDQGKVLDERTIIELLDARTDLGILDPMVAVD